MLYFIDLLEIDNNQWPAKGPAHDFLGSHGYASNGILIAISLIQRRFEKVVVRQRGYQIDVPSETNYKETTTKELVISDTEFLASPLKSYRITKLLRLINICYGLVALDLDSENIVCPAGLYDERFERRIQWDYFRPKKPSEIIRGPHVTQLLSKEAEKRLALNGMYCYDKTKRPSLITDIENILNKSKIADRAFGLKPGSRDRDFLNSDKVEALLASALDLEKDRYEKLKKNIRRLKSEYAR